MTTKLLKGLVILTLALLLSPSLFSQTAIPPLPEGYTVAEGYLLLEETVLEEVVTQKVKEGTDKAVKDAVAIAVKEEQKKNVDLQTSNDDLTDKNTSLTLEIKNLKRDKVRDIILWTGGGVVVGTALGIIINSLIQAQPAQAGN